MPSTQLLLRFAKVVLTGAIALMAILIVIGNLTDYLTNFLFVQHVLKMDTTFPSSHIRYRSINSNLFYHVSYVLIIVTEALVAICCTRGSLLLYTKIKAGAADFHAAKNWGIAGIVSGILLWFAGFEVIGGEWFGMWQSSTWNGLASAERVTGVLLFTLILLHLKDEELPQV